MVTEIRSCGGLVGMAAAVLLVGWPAVVLGTAWQAGVAKVNITPTEPMRMAGYAARDRAAEGKLTDLWAKALVLQPGSGPRAMLITLDLIGIDRHLAKRLCTMLSEQHGLPRSQIARCCSHTHPGPVVANTLRPMNDALLDNSERGQVAQYARFLQDQIELVAGEASARMGPAQLAWGQGRTTLAVNRRANPEVDVPALRATGRLQGPCDYDVPVLAVRRPDGTLVAVAFGYACHATVLDFYQWSGDYPGFAQLELEKAHPGCVALFTAGCGADQNPLPRRRVALAQQYGRQLAAAVDDVLAGVMATVGAQLTCHYREIDLPLGPLPTAAELQVDTQSDDIYVAARGRMLLAQIDSGQPLSADYPYPVQTWCLGNDRQMVFLGGEVVVDYALRVKSESGTERTWVAGYSNDVMAYIPSRRVLQEGGYEGATAMVYFGLPTVWAPELEELIMAEVRSQLAASP